ncbi:MAG: ATP-binding protein, partial [Betaproteobacteria bacterium]|nr:ATP-binding protein [Betaproteobacteria bacterium]
MGSDREISFSGKPEVSTRGRSGERMRKLPRKSGRLVREVENRRQQAWEMEEAEERARIMLDATPLPAYLWGWDGELNLLECNQAILHLFGLNDKPEVAVRFFEMSPERQPDGMPSKEKALAFLHAAFETGYQTFEWMHCLPSGEPLPAKVTLRRIPWKNSWCIAAYVQDLREVKKQEQQAREAEERARIMLDATPLVCTLWDVDGNVIDCNQEAVNVLGLKDKAEYIEGFYNRAPEYQPNGQSSRSEVLRIARATLESGSQRFEWVSRTKSGELLPFESTTVRLPWKGSYRLASYARDLSASKLKEQQKREAEERSRILLDSTPIGATLWDSETTIFDCNQAMLRMFGFTDKAEFMRRFHDLNPEFQPDGTASRAKSLALMRAAFETGYQEFEWMHRTASREALPVAIILVRSPWKGGWCVAGYARDLREAKAHEQKMREADAYAKSLEVASQAAQVASQTKSEFLAKMSHELRTPLNAAIGFLGLELQKALPQETADNLETAQEACYSLLHLINDILDISKIEAGHFELSCDNYRLASFISEVVSLNSFRVSGESVVFRLEVDENLPSQLYGDDLRIKQVLNNLLSNAFKYTGKGAVTLRIEVEPGAKEQNGSLLIRFSVRDTGRGIAAKNLQNLFDSYARFDSMTNRRIEGTGLGLAISKNFVETMGGRIHVESTYRKGSVFSCIIPQRVVDPTPLGSATVRMLSLRDMRQKYGNERSRSWQCSYLPYARVLVVDDVPTNLGVAKGMLQRYGMSVDCVTSGQQAVKLMRS